MIPQPAGTLQEKKIGGMVPEDDFDLFICLCPIRFERFGDVGEMQPAVEVQIAIDLIALIGPVRDDSIGTGGLFGQGGV